MKKKFYYILVLSLLFNQMFVSEPAYAEETGGFSKYFDSPVGILIVSGIAAVYSAILYKAAAKQEKESEENIKKIDKMIANFKDSYSGFCPKGREDLSDPGCYCYTDGGKKNAARTNSQICINQWAKNDYKLGADASDYGIAAYNPDVAGCVSVTGVFDEGCKCKKYLDSSGKNACKKESTITMPSTITSGVATGIGIKDLLKFSANSSNGNPRFDLMDAGSLATKAINARKFADQMLEKVAADQRPPKITEANVDKFARAVLGSTPFNGGGGSSSGAMNIASVRSDNPAVASLLEQAQAKVGIDVTGSGKGLSTKFEKKKGPTFSFSGEVSGNSGGQVLGGFPEKSYKYKNSDIVTDEGASIFEIISNRYVQSGLKRLFDDESEAVPADEPKAP